MIPNAVMIEQQSTFDGIETIEMSIDSSSLSFLMSTLSNLYNDRELAVIRELSTNGRDSMIAAGRADFPLEVTLPGPLSNFLKIKDTGLGMDLADIKNTYALYGASTKRNSNEFNGVLGLGSKSPFTYCDQYTVTAVKDGIKTSVLVSRSEAGGGSMEILFQNPTNDLNGVEVVIPARPGNDFRSKAFDFYQYWKPGTVLINGNPPVHFEGTQINARTFILERETRYGNMQDIVVMGNVPYPITATNTAYKAVHYVNIGEVNFVPSREALQDTALTQKTIEVLRSDLRKHIEQVAKDEIDAAPSIIDSRPVIRKWANMLNRNTDTFSYRGTRYESRIEAFFEEKDSWGNDNKIGGTIYNPRSYGRKTYGASPYLSLDDFYHSSAPIVIVHGEYRSKIYPSQQQKMVKWALDNNVVNPSFVVLRDDLTSPWVADAPRVKWADIVAIKLPTKKRVPRPLEFSIWKQTVYGLGWVNTKETLDDTKPIVYSGLKDSYRIKYVSGSLPADTQFVRLSATRHPTLIKEYPTAKKIQEALTDSFDKFVASLSAGELDSLTYIDEEIALLRVFKAYESSIEDKSLMQAVKTYDNRQKVVQQLGTYRTAKSEIYSWQMPEVKQVEDSISVLDNYPLLQVLSHYNLTPEAVKHAIEYINYHYNGGK